MANTLKQEEGRQLGGLPLASTYYPERMDGMIRNVMVSLRPVFALLGIALLIYRRVLYAKHRKKKDGVD